MAYRYGVLWMDDTPEALAHNKQLLGPRTLGIEVTDPAYAELCGLGNIDPQHSGEGGSSAIEEALFFQVPDSGAVLVTQREDKDSLGAMAVLALRSAGKEGAIDKALVAWAGAMDRHGGRIAFQLNPQLASMFRTGQEIQALNTISKNDKHWPDVDAKVRDIGRVLCGEIPQKEMRWIMSLPKPTLGDFKLELYGPVAFIEAPGRYEEARNWASARGPVAVIFDPVYKKGSSGSYRRWSVVSRDRCFDHEGFRTLVLRAEAEARGVTLEQLEEQHITCGGPPHITSSSKGVGRESALTKAQIVALACEHVNLSGTVGR